MSDSYWMDFYQDDSPQVTTSHNTHNDEAKSDGDIKSTKENYDANLVLQDEKSKAMLHIGGYYAACSRDFLALNKIHVIVNCGYELKNQFPTSIIYKSIPLDDVDDAPLLEYVDSATNFIDKYIASGENVLVHCQMGRSRSASIVIAYLMKYRNLSLQAAYDLLKSKRPAVKPNDGFLKQLAEWIKV